VIISLITFSPNLVGVGQTVTEIDAVDYTGGGDFAMFDIIYLCNGTR